MSMVLTMHRCRSIRVHSYTRSNANHISLYVRKDFGYDGKGSEDIELSMYNLPYEVTDALLEAFGDAETTDYDLEKLKLQAA